MKINQIIAESTTAGCIAPVASPVGKMQSRIPKVKKGGNLLKGKKTNKPFYEDRVEEAKLDEEDKIISPDKGKKLKAGLHGKGEQPKFAGYKPPFKSSGLWVSDRRGNNICECPNEKLAPTIAKALNAYMASNETITSGGVIAGGGVG